MKNMTGPVLDVCWADVSKFAKHFIFDNQDEVQKIIRAAACEYPSHLNRFCLEMELYLIC